MSVLQVVTVQPHRVRGGPSIQHLAFLEQLREQGFTWHTVFPEGHEMTAEFERVSETTLPLPSIPTVPRSPSPRAWVKATANSARASRAIARYIKSVEAKLVYTCNEVCPAPAVAASIAQVPVVNHVLGMSIFSSRAVAQVYGRILRSMSDHILCCQEPIRDQLLAVGAAPESLTVVHNCIDPEAICAAADQSLDDQSLMREPDTLRIGMVAGMDRRKGHHNLLTAASQVLAKEPRARFFIVGSTSGDLDYLEELRRTIHSRGLEQKFRLVGSVPHTAPWLSSFDVYCIPSLTEALSVAGLEAMALERPLVATRVGGNPYMVEHGVSGLIAEAANPDDLARQILRLLSDPEARRRMGAAGATRARRDFSVVPVSRKLGQTLKRTALGSSEPG